jgi:hypothetical protein
VSLHYSPGYEPARWSSTADVYPCHRNSGAVARSRLLLLPAAATRGQPEPLLQAVSPSSQRGGGSGCDQRAVSGCYQGAAGRGGSSSLGRYQLLPGPGENCGVRAASSLVVGPPCPLLMFTRGRPLTWPASTPPPLLSPSPLGRGRKTPQVPELGQKPGAYFTHLVPPPHHQPHF